MTLILTSLIKSLGVGKLFSGHIMKMFTGSYSRIGLPVLIWSETDDAVYAVAAWGTRCGRLGLHIERLARWGTVSIPIHHRG